MIKPNPNPNQVGVINPNPNPNQVGVINGVNRLGSVLSFLLEPLLVHSRGGLAAALALPALLGAHTPPISRIHLAYISLYIPYTSPPSSVPISPYISPISPVSPLYLPYISLYLPYISPPSSVPHAAKPEPYTNPARTCPHPTRTLPEPRPPLP